MFETSTSKARGNPAKSTQSPRIYELISRVLRKAIRRGAIPPGTVLLEGHLATILHSTRTPIRRALQMLEEDGIVSRFDGRGYIAGSAGVEPKRIALSAAMLGVDGSVEPVVHKTLGWQAIYDEVERDIVHLSVFDRYRVNELELARHFNVGRVVARDVLLRLEALGLLEKDARLRWVTKPLDARRLNHLYELRLLLEPTALRSSVPAVTLDELHTMMCSLRRVMADYPRTTRVELDQLEADLHIRLLSRCPNVDLLHSLERTRCVLTLSKHALGETVPMPPSDPFMSEHLGILEAIAQGEMDVAQNLLREHLEASRLKLITRIEVVRNTYKTPTLPYIVQPRSGHYQGTSA